jgi:hypothetical protein
MVCSSSGRHQSGVDADQAAYAVPFGKRSRWRGADGAEIGSLQRSRALRPTNNAPINFATFAWSLCER